MVIKPPHHSLCLLQPWWFSWCDLSNLPPPAFHNFTKLKIEKRNLFIKSSLVQFPLCVVCLDEQPEVVTEVVGRLRNSKFIFCSVTFYTSTIWSLNVSNPFLDSKSIPSNLILCPMKTIMSRGQDSNNRWLFPGSFKCSTLSKLQTCLW